MPDGLSLSPTLKQAVKTSLQRAKGSRQRDIALVWRGYIEALREFQVLSDDAAIADLLPNVQDDPMADGWKASWLASFEQPDPEGMETVDMKTVVIARRHSAAG